MGKEDLDSGGSSLRLGGGVWPCLAGLLSDLRTLVRGSVFPRFSSKTRGYPNPSPYVSVQSLQVIRETKGLKHKVDTPSLISNTNFLDPGPVIWDDLYK